MSCTVPGCTKQAVKRGWCPAHYRRWHKTGDVRADVPLRAFQNRYAQIMSKVQTDAPDGHWFWTGHINVQTGYGMVSLNRRPTTAHRAVWELLVGPIPDGHEPDHVCRVRHCVRPHPDHCEVVTHSENMRRALAFKRAQQQRTAP